MTSPCGTGNRREKHRARSKQIPALSGRPQSAASRGRKAIDFPQHSRPAETPVIVLLSFRPNLNLRRKNSDLKARSGAPVASSPSRDWSKINNRRGFFRNPAAAVFASAQCYRGDECGGKGRAGGAREGARRPEYIARRALRRSQRPPWKLRNVPPPAAAAATPAALYTPEHRRVRERGVSFPQHGGGGGARAPCKHIAGSLMRQIARRPRRTVGLSAEGPIFPDFLLGRRGRLRDFGLDKSTRLVLLMNFRARRFGIYSVLSPVSRYSGILHGIQIK